MPPTTTSTKAARDRARRIAAEELTGLALQERGLTTLLARQLAETPAGRDRQRLERHLRTSREHQRTFAERASALSASRGPAELVAGVVRSGFATAGAVGASVAQVATAPIALLRKGGRDERLLENAGVEGAAVANKLVILTAVSHAAERAGDDRTHDALARVRQETLDAWEELLDQTPQLMDGLVEAKAA